MSSSVSSEEMGKQIGVLREVSPARPASASKPSASPVYRNVLAENGFPEGIGGATTLYEVFNNSVAKYGDKK